jgi:signal transduction histidine kinase
VECSPPAPCQGERTRRLTEIAHEFEMDVVLWDEKGALIFETGQRPFPPVSPPAKSRWHRPLGALRLIPLGNGKTLGVRERGHFGPRGTWFLPMLGGLAVLLAVGLLPLSRSITRRIEQLAEGARRWGEGDLGHRVPVSGRDEIAALANRFNQTAAAIETLLAQERQMLASASHEFRSPLARIRMALELLAEEADPARRTELSRRASEDIAELDGLVEELLLAARAQPGVPRRPLTQVDLLALVQGRPRPSAQPSPASRSPIFANQPWSSVWCEI